MASGSKYEAILRVVEKKSEIFSLGVDDSVRQKEIEAELKRIDEETNREIEEIKATPVDTKLIQQQAKADLESAKKENKRVTLTAIQTAEDCVESAEAEVKDAQNLVKKAKRELDVVKERSAEVEANFNLKAQQEYERTISSIGNIEQTLSLRIQKAKAYGEERKSRLNIELDRIKAKNDAQKERVELWDKAYNDLKEISLKLGDAGSK